jgi:hypothetical protein
LSFLPGWMLGTGLEMDETSELRCKLTKFWGKGMLAAAGMTNLFWLALKGWPLRRITGQTPVLVVLLEVGMSCSKRVLAASMK